jgi:hypothetical protein
VAGGGDRPQHQPAQVQLLLVVQALVGELEVGGAGDEDAGAAGGQFAAAGDEVGVQVGLDRMGDPQPPLVGQVQVGGRVAGRVDHQRPPVAEVDQVGTVAEPLVEYRDDRNHGRLLGLTLG